MRGVGRLVTERAIKMLWVNLRKKKDRNSFSGPLSSDVWDEGAVHGVSTKRTIALKK